MYINIENNKLILIAFKVYLFTKDTFIIWLLCPSQKLLPSFTIDAQNLPEIDNLTYN